MKKTGQRRIKDNKELEQLYKRLDIVQETKRRRQLGSGHDKWAGCS